MPSNNEDSGALFRQEEKKHEKSPDYTGNCTVDGVEWRIAGWLNTAKTTGKVYLGLRFTRAEDFEKQRQQFEAQQQQQSSPGQKGLDDPFDAENIPF